MITEMKETQSHKYSYQRNHMFHHLRDKHKDAIKASNSSDKKFENIDDCGKYPICIKIYGKHNHNIKFWCKRCTSELQLKKQKRIEEKKELKVCSECGAKVQNMGQHLESIHSSEKCMCPSCSKEFLNQRYLKEHINSFHEKIPCTECGKLFGKGQKMKRHIQQAHTLDDQKRYKCEVCGKGFVDSTRLKDHTNIHTGEKPYKCKFCTSCFASKGTHAMHERGHLGQGRKHKK